MTKTRIIAKRRTASVETRSSVKSARNTQEGEDSASATDESSGQHEIEDNPEAHSGASVVGEARGDHLDPVSVNVLDPTVPVDAATCTRPGGSPSLSP